MNSQDPLKGMNQCQTVVQFTANDHVSNWTRNSFQPTKHNPHLSFFFWSNPHICLKGDESVCWLSIISLSICIRWPDQEKKVNLKPCLHLFFSLTKNMLISSKQNQVSISFNFLITQWKLIWTSKSLPTGTNCLFVLFFLV